MWNQVKLRCTCIKIQNLVRNLWVRVMSLGQIVWNMWRHVVNQCQKKKCDIKWMKWLKELRCWKICNDRWQNELREMIFVNCDDWDLAKCYEMSKELNKIYWTNWDEINEVYDIEVRSWNPFAFDQKRCQLFSDSISNIGISKTHAFLFRNYCAIVMKPLHLTIGISNKVAI